MADHPLRTPPDSDITQLARLLDPLVNGLVPADREAEALAIVQAITIHVITEQQRLYRVAFDVGRIVGEEQARAEQRLQAYIQETIQGVIGTGQAPAPEVIPGVSEPPKLLH